MKNAFKVVVLGSPMVGKTTLIEEAIYGNHYRLNRPYTPTNEDIYCALIEYEKNLKEKIFFYDYAGIKEIDLDTLKSFLLFCDAFLLVFSIDQQSSLQVALNIKKNIDRLRDKKDIPIIMVANKMDKITEAQMNLDEVRKLAIQEKIKYNEVTAMDRKSISDCFIKLAHQLSIVSKSSSFSRRPKSGSVQLEL